MDAASRRQRTGSDDGPQAWSEVARLSALAPRLEPQLARAARGATTRLARTRPISAERRRAIEGQLVRWLEDRLRSDPPAEPLPARALLEHDLSSKEVSVLLSAFRARLVRALNVGGTKSESKPASLRDIKALEACFDQAILELLENTTGELHRRFGREERLVMLGQLVASLIHELRNPLSVIDTSLLLIERRARRGQSVEVHVSRARAQVDRSRKMIDDLLDMLRQRPVQRQRVQLPRVIDATLETLGPDRARVAVQLAEGVSEVEIDPSQIQQVLQNLVTNALEASHPGAAVELELSSSGGEVIVQVRDRGAGIAADVLPTLFEPLVSTKPNGVGMGLAISRRLAEQNLGRLEAQNADTGGAIFRLILPEPLRPTEPPLPPTESVT